MGRGCCPAPAGLVLLHLLPRALRGGPQAVLCVLQPHPPSSAPGPGSELCARSQSSGISVTGAGIPRAREERRGTLESCRDSPAQGEAALSTEPGEGCSISGQHFPSGKHQMQHREPGKQMVRGGESHCSCTASLTPWGQILQTGKIPKSSLIKLLTGGAKQPVQTQIC